MESNNPQVMIQPQPAAQQAQVVGAVSAPTSSLNTNVIWGRIFATFVEIVLWGIILFVAGMFFGSHDVLKTSTTTTNFAGQIVNQGQDVTYNSSLTGLPGLIYFIFVSLYFILLEWLVGGTIGKMIFGLKVTNEAGQKISLMQSIIRNLLRLIDGIFFLGLILIATNDKKQRLGDKVAHTLVIKR